MSTFASVLGMHLPVNFAIEVDPALPQPRHLRLAVGYTIDDLQVLTVEVLLFEHVPSHIKFHCPLVGIVTVIPPTLGLARAMNQPIDKLFIFCVYFMLAYAAQFVEVLHRFALLRRSMA